MRGGPSRGVRQNRCVSFFARHTGGFGDHPPFCDHPPSVLSADGCGFADVLGLRGGPSKNQKVGGNLAKGGWTTQVRISNFGGLRDHPGKGPLTFNLEFLQVRVRARVRAHVKVPPQKGGWSRKYLKLLTRRWVVHPPSALSEPKYAYWASWVFFPEGV